MSQSLFEIRVTNSPCRPAVACLHESIWTLQCPYVRATEQLPDMFNRDSSESSCSAVSPMSDANNAQRDFDKGSWKQKLEDS